MRAWGWAGLVGCLLLCGCSSGGPPGSHGSTAADSTGATTTDEDPTTGGATEPATTDDSTGDATTGDSTGDSTTGSTTGSTGGSTGGVECVPPPDDGDSTGAGTTTGEPVDPAEPIESWQAYVLAECTAYLECGCAAPDGFGKDLATCVAIREAELGDLAAQGFVWDGECAGARVAGLVAECNLEASSCEASKCELFHGTGVLGEPCANHWGAPLRSDGSGCGADLYCHGVCTPLCTGVWLCGSEVCPPNSHCFHDDSDEGFCVADVGLGMHCGKIYGPGCADGLVCAGGDTWDGTCVRPGAACEPCRGDDLCEPGLFCDAQTGLCLPLRPDAEPCVDGVQCQHASCGDDGLCAPLPEAGEPCVFGHCAEGFKCGWSQTCHAPVPRGAPCPDKYECTDGLTCTPDTICEPPPCYYL